MDNSTIILPEEELKNKDTASVAQTLYKFGFNVIPLTKELLPSVSYEVYLKQKLPSEIFTQWLSEKIFENLAVVCGSVSGITCIDVDEIRLFKKSFRSAELLINYCKFKEKTKKGGLHLYFKFNPFVEGRCIQKSVFGVDVLNYGLSFCAPSRNSEGCYELIEAKGLVEIPGEFIKEFKQRQIYKQLPELLELIKEIYIEGYRQLISLYLSGFFKKIGFTQEKSEEILEEVWAEFEPNLTKEEKKQRQTAIKGTFKKSDAQAIKGISGLQEIAEDLLGIEEGAKWISELSKLFNYKPTEATTPEDLEEARRLLRDPLLLDKIINYFNQSYIGREKEKKLLYLICLFVKLNSSTIVIVTGETSSGKSSLVETVLSAIPEDVKMNFTATSERFFLYLNKPLHNKIVTIYEINGATALPFLKTFVTEGKASIGSVVKIRGELQPVEIQKDTRGLVLFTTTTKQAIDEETANRGFVIEIDTPPELVRQILTQKQKLKTPNFKILQTLFKLLEPASVVVPYVQSLAENFAYDKPRRLRDYDKVVALIKAHALLYQFQRHRNEKGEIIATLDDYKAIFELSNIIVPSLSELTPKQQEFLSWIKPNKSKTEIKEYWKSGKASRQSVFLWLKKLTELGYIEVNDHSYIVSEDLDFKFTGLPQPETLPCSILQFYNTTQSVDNSCNELSKVQNLQDFTIRQESDNVSNCKKLSKMDFRQLKPNSINTLDNSVKKSNEKVIDWIEELEEF
jgi:uncharacterized protein (DUF3820 family)/energy-coupling factor transporter ATP-binding protein EcfA2